MTNENVFLFMESRVLGGLWIAAKLVIGLALWSVYGLFCLAEKAVG